MLCYFCRLNIPFMPESAVLLFWHKNLLYNSVGIVQEED